MIRSVAQTRSLGRFGERTTKMADTQPVAEKNVEPCRVCGSVKFNPMCPECREILEESLLLGVEAEPHSA